MDELAVGRRQRFAGVALIGAVMLLIAAVVSPAFRSATLDRVPITFLAALVILVLAPLVIWRGGRRLIQVLAAATILGLVCTALLIVMVTIGPSTADGAFRVWWLGPLAIFGVALRSAPLAAWRRGVWA